MGVGPEVTEVRLEVVALLNVVELEHKVVELGTELIKLIGSADVTVVRDAEEIPETLALTRDCLGVGILMNNKWFCGKKRACEKCIKRAKDYRALLD